MEVTPTSNRETQLVDQEPFDLKVASEAAAADQGDHFVAIDSPRKDDKKGFAHDLLRTLTDPFRCCRAEQTEASTDIEVKLEDWPHSESNENSSTDCSVPLAKGQSPANGTAKADLNGKFILDRVDGDFDTFLSDMGQGWIIRRAGAAIGYGVEKVRVDVCQSGDDFVFHKVLALGGVGHTEFTVGASDVSFRDDIGTVINVSSWDGRVLHFDGTHKSTGLGITTRLFINETGEFVSEITTYKGTRVFLFFRPRA